MSARPLVSVIIPTHNRIESLLRTLTAFEGQTFDPREMELIVVADGCSDATSSTLRSRPTRLDCELIELSGLGAGAARNAGAEAARGSILLFMDDDIEPAPDLVAAHVRAHGEHPGRVVMGPYPPSLRGRSSFFRMRTRSWWQSHFDRLSRPGHRFTYRDLVSGNLSIDAGLFRRIGGFDPSIPGAGGEDYELGVRLLEAGVELHFEPEAGAVHHEHETMTLEGSLRRARHEGRAEVVIGRRHPKLRRELFADLLEPGHRPGRLLRYLVYRRPSAGRVLAWLARASLPVVEILRMRHRWRKLFGMLFAYWRARGVADTLRTEATLAAYLERGRVVPPTTRDELLVDLAEGLDAAERRLDAARPDSVRLRYGTYELGRVEAVLLAEPLSGRHLRPILAERFSWPLMRALAHRATSLAEIGPTHRSAV